VSALSLEVVLGFGQTSFLDNKLFGSLVVEFTSSNELKRDNLQGGFTFGDLRR